MEIAPVPRRPPLSAVARVLVVVALLLPLMAVTLVPVMLGLQTYVVTGDAMGGSMGRGAIIYARSVPVSDLEVGDVITFPRPDEPDGTAPRVTRRVIGLDAGVARTRGDEQSDADPWTLPLDGPVVTRVVLGIPWIGYPFGGLLGAGTWALVGIGSVALLVVPVATRRGRVRARVAVPTR